MAANNVVRLRNSVVKNFLVEKNGSNNLVIQKQIHWLLIIRLVFLVAIEELAPLVLNQQLLPPLDQLTLLLIEIILLPLERDILLLSQIPVAGFQILDL